MGRLKTSNKFLGIMSDEEYQKRIRILQTYFPFLEHIIKRLEGEEGKFRETRILKLQSILEILKNAEEKKLQLHVLLKCEEAILKFCEKVQKNQSSETMYKCMCQSSSDDKYQFGSHLNSADGCSAAQQQADLNLTNSNSSLENSLLAKLVVIPTEKVQNYRHVLFADKNDENSPPLVTENLYKPVELKAGPCTELEEQLKISKPYPAVAPKPKQIPKVLKKVVKEQDSMFGILLSTIDEQIMSKKNRKKIEKKAVKVGNDVKKDNKSDKTKKDIQLKYKKDEISINENLIYEEKKNLKINHDLEHKSKYSKHITKHKENKKDSKNMKQKSKSKDETKIKDKDSINKDFSSKSKDKEVRSRDKESITKCKELKHKENESKNKDDKKTKARMKSEEYDSKINKIVSKLYYSKNKDIKSTSNNSKNKVQKSTVINKVDKSRRPLTKEEKQKTDRTIGKTTVLSTHLSKIDAKKSEKIPFQTNFYNQNDIFGHNQDQVRLRPDQFKQNQFRTNHDQCHSNQDHRPGLDQSQENYDQFRSNKNDILIDAQRNSDELRPNFDFLNNNYPSRRKFDYHQSQPQEQNSLDFYENEDKIKRDYFCYQRSFRDGGSHYSNRNVEWVDSTTIDENRREYQEEERKHSPCRFFDKGPRRSKLEDIFSKEDQRFPIDEKSDPQGSRFEEKRALQIEENCENHRKMRFKEKRNEKPKIEPNEEISSSSDSLYKTVAKPVVHKGYVKNFRIPKICKADSEQEKKNAFEGRKCIKENREGQEESKQDDAKEKEIKIDLSTSKEVTKTSKTETEEKLNMFDKFTKHIFGTCESSFLTQYYQSGRSDSESEEEIAKEENKQEEKVTVEEISRTKKPEEQTSDKLQEEENVIGSKKIRNTRRKQRVYSSDSSSDREEQEIAKEEYKQAEKVPFEDTSRTKELEQQTSDKLQEEEENVNVSEKIRNARRKQRIYSSDSSSEKEEENKQADKVTVEETSRSKESKQQTPDKLQEEGENIIVSERIRNTRRKQRIYSSDSSSEKEEENKQADKVTVEETSRTKESKQQTPDKLQEEGENIIASERIRNTRRKQRIYSSDSSSEKEIAKEENKQAEKVTVEETVRTKEREQQTSDKLQEEEQNIIVSERMRNTKRKQSIYSSDSSSEKDEGEIVKDDNERAERMTVEETSRTKKPGQQTSDKLQQEEENVIVSERIRNTRRKHRIYSSDSSSEKEEEIAGEESKQAEKVTAEETARSKEPDHQTSDILQEEEENVIVSERIRNTRRKHRIYSSDSSSEKEEEIAGEESKQAEKITVEETAREKEPDQQTSDTLQEEGENIIVSERIRNTKRKQNIFYSSDSSSEKDEEIAKEDYKQTEKVTVEETTPTKEPKQQTSDKLEEEKENVIANEKIRNTRKKRKIYSSDFSSKKPLAINGRIPVKEKIIAKKLMIKSPRKQNSFLKLPQDTLKSLIEGDLTVTDNQHEEQEVSNMLNNSKYNEKENEYGISDSLRLAIHETGRSPKTNLKSFTNQKEPLNKEEKTEEINGITSEKSKLSQRRHRSLSPVFLEKISFSYVESSDEENSADRKEKNKKEEMIFVEPKVSEVKPEKKRRGRPRKKIAEASVSLSTIESKTTATEKEEMILVEPKISEVKSEKKRRGGPRTKITKASASLSTIEFKTTETEKQEMIFVEPKISEVKPERKKPGRPRKKIVETSVSLSTIGSKTTETEKIEFERGKYVEKLKKKKLVKKRKNYWANGILKRYNCKKYTVDRSILTSSQSTKTRDLIPDIYYFLDNGNCFYCKLCNYKGKFIVQHYRTKHPESENLISRLNPDEAEKALAESKLNKFEEIEPFEEVENGMKRKTTFVCRFCNISLTTEVSTFVDHVCSHTGEYRYSCELCPYFAIKKRILGNHCYKIHPELKPLKLNPNWLSPPNFRLMFGYLCKACNFTQILKKNVEKHINVSHLEQNIEIIKISMSSESVILNDIISSENVETKLDDNEKSNEKTPEPEPIRKIGTDMNVFVEPDEKTLEPEPIKQIGTDINVLVEPDDNTPSEELIEKEKFKTIEEIFSSITSKRSALQFINQLKNKFESILCEDDYENTLTDIENHPLEEVYSEGLNNLKKELFSPQDFSLKICGRMRQAETESNYEDNQDISPTKDTTRIANTCSLAGLESFETENEDSQNSFEEDETTELSNEVVDVNPKPSYPDMGFLQIKDIRTLNEEEEHNLQSNLQNTSSKLVDSQINLQIIQPNLINVEKDVTYLPANNELSKYVSSAYIHKSTYKKQPTAENIIWYKTKKIFNEMLVYPKILDLYKCPLEFCSFSSGSQKEFTIHMTSHTWCSITVCVYCQEGIKPENLIMHIDTIHSHCTLQCAFCFYRTISKKYLLHHQKNVHKQSCNTLVEGLFHQLDPTNTTQFVFDIPPRNAIILPYKCIQDNCTQQYLLAEDFMVHLHIYHKKNFMCAICDDRTYYVTAQNLIQHYMMHNIARYQCQYCICGRYNMDTMFMHYAQNHQHLEPICYVRQKKKENVSSQTLDDIILINMESKQPVEPKLNTQQLPEQSTSEQIINISSPTITSTIPAEKNLFTSFVDTSSTTNVIIDWKDYEIINIDSTTDNSQIIEFVDLNEEERHFSEPCVTLKHRNIESKNAIEIENAVESLPVDNFEISHGLTKNGTNLFKNKLAIHPLKKDRDKNNFIVEAINEKDMEKEKGTCILKCKEGAPSQKEKNKDKQEMRRIKCPEYEHSSNFYRPMRQHLINHFTKPMQCSHCNTCFIYPINLKNHHIQKHGDLPLIINKVPKFTKQINKITGPMLHLNEDGTYSTKNKLKRKNNSTGLDEPPTKILVVDGKLDNNPPIKRYVAKKSTSNRPKNLEFSFYGTKPCDINDCRNVMSEIEIMNKVMRINVVAMSHILNLSPTVQLVDIKNQISL